MLIFIRDLLLELVVLLQLLAVSPVLLPLDLVEVSFLESFINLELTYK